METPRIEEGRGRASVRVGVRRAQGRGPWQRRRGTGGKGWRSGSEEGGCAGVYDLSRRVRGRQFGEGTGVRAEAATGEEVLRPGLTPRLLTVEAASWRAIGARGLVSRNPFTGDGTRLLGVTTRDSELSPKRLSTLLRDTRSLGTPLGRLLSSPSRTHLPGEHSAGRPTPTPRPKPRNGRQADLLRPEPLAPCLFVSDEKSGLSGQSKASN